MSLHVYTPLSLDEIGEVVNLTDGIEFFCQMPDGSLIFALLGEREKIRLLIEPGLNDDENLCIFSGAIPEEEKKPLEAQMKSSEKLAKIIRSLIFNLQDDAVVTGDNLVYSEHYN